MKCPVQALLPRIYWGPGTLDHTKIPEYIFQYGQAPERVASVVGDNLAWPGNSCFHTLKLQVVTFATSEFFIKLSESGEIPKGIPRFAAQS